MIGSQTRAARYESWLWLAQRGTAALLALCVVVHLVTITYAVRGGLSAIEILGRTRGSVAWFGFYLLFVLAVSLHAPIGVRSILRELTPWRGWSVDAAMVVFGVLLAFCGARAAWGLFQ